MQARGRRRRPGGSRDRRRPTARVPGSWQLCVWRLAVGSSHYRQQPPPAHAPRPSPHFPCVLATDRKEDDLRAANDILERYVSDLAEDTAVGGVVAIVAHHEDVPGRHLIDRGIVIQAVFYQL